MISQPADSASASNAADGYALQVDRVLAQRLRLRGAQPEPDLFGGLAPGHRLLKSDPHRPLDANLEIVASYIEANDVLVDVGGGAGRISLPLAARCREVINVDPSAVMGAGFLSTASSAGIHNVRFIEGDWLDADPPAGTVALVNHVTYMTRDIVPFLIKLEQAGTRRVIITVNSPPPPARRFMLYAMVHGEPEAPIPGHAELMNVLWEMGRLPELRMLPNDDSSPLTPFASREAAIEGTVSSFQSEQWSFWPYSSELELKVRKVVIERFNELFAEEEGRYRPLWYNMGREVLITWRPGIDRVVEP